MQISIKPQIKSNNLARIDVLSKVDTELRSSDIGPGYRKELEKARDDLNGRVISDARLQGILNLVKGERAGRNVPAARRPDADTMERMSNGMRPLLLGKTEVNRDGGASALIEVPTTRHHVAQLEVALASPQQVSELIAGFDKMSDAEQNTLARQLEAVGETEDRRAFARGIQTVCATVTVGVAAYLFFINIIQEQNTILLGAAALAGALERGSAAKKHAANLKAAKAEVEDVVRGVLAQTPRVVKNPPPEPVRIKADIAITTN